MNSRLQPLSYHFFQTRGPFDEADFLVELRNVVGKRVEVLAGEALLENLDHFSGHAAAAVGGVRPDVDEISIANAIRKHAVRADDVVRIEGDAGGEAVGK